MGSVHSGMTTPLNEKGYQELAKSKSDGAMCVFIERVLWKELGSEVTNRGDLAGFAPYYSGSKQVQSYQALLSELKTVKWVQQSKPKSGYHCEPDQWKPDVLCDGIKAEERADWLVKEMGMTRDQARGKVIEEFPKNFPASKGGHKPAGGASSGKWNPMADCDGAKAQDRVKWLKDNEGMTEQAAQAKVMSEFPVVFRWNPEAMCGDSRAKDRADWLMQNQGMNEKQAKEKIMAEFPGMF